MATGVWSTSQRCSHSSWVSSAGRRSRAVLAKRIGPAAVGDLRGVDRTALVDLPAGHPVGELTEHQQDAVQLVGPASVQTLTTAEMAGSVVGIRIAFATGSSSRLTCSRVTPASASARRGASSRSSEVPAPQRANMYLVTAEP